MPIHGVRRVRALALTCALSAVMLLGTAAGAGAQQLRGVALHPMASDQSATLIQKEFSLLQAAGATSVRFDVFWTSVEWSAKGVYDAPTLSWLDWVFSQAQAHGLKVILDVWSTPCWASSAPVSVSLNCGYGWWNYPVRYYPPVNAQDYADFVAFAAKRWASALAAVELWNEPNGAFLYGVNKAQAYSQLVEAAYPAVKAVEPQLPVIMSLAGTDTTFLSELYAYGVKGYYDGIAVHPYNQPYLDGLKAFRAFQLANGDSTPLYVTEVGWSSGSVGTYWQAVGVQMMLTELAALPYVAAVEIYDMRDDSSTDPAGEFGMFDMSMTAKPAWSAFTSTLASLSQPVSATTATVSGTRTHYVKPSRHATRGDCRRHSKRKGRKLRRHC